MPALTGCCRQQGSCCLLPAACMDIHEHQQQLGAAEKATPAAQPPLLSLPPSCSLSGPPLAMLTPCSCPCPQADQHRHAAAPAPEEHQASQRQPVQGRPHSHAGHAGRAQHAGRAVRQAHAPRRRGLHPRRRSGRLQVGTHPTFIHSGILALVQAAPAGCMAQQAALLHGCSRVRCVLMHGAMAHAMTCTHAALPLAAVAGSYERCPQGV